MTKKVRCCLIEDNDISVFTGKRLMAQHSSFDEPSVYTNGKEAFEAFRSLHSSDSELPDVVVLDLQMPIWDGWDLLDALSTELPDWSVPIFITTSSIDPADKERAKQYPAVQQLFEKPLSTEKLDEIVATVFGEL